MTEQTEFANMSLADLIREYQRLDEYTDEHTEDDAASDRLDDVRDAIGDRVEAADFWTYAKSGRPVWNEEAVDALLGDLNPDDEDWGTIAFFLDEQFDEVEEEYEECISTTYAPRDRNIKCKDLAAKLEPYGIEVRRDAEQKSYHIFHKPGRTFEFEWENPPGVKRTKTHEVLETVEAYWRGRTGKLDYFKVGSDYLKERDGQITGADHILKALRETCDELLHGEEAAAVLVAQENSSPYWMTTNVLQRNMLIIEEQFIKRALKEQQNKEAA